MIGDLPPCVTKEEIKEEVSKFNSVVRMGKKRPIPLPIVSQTPDNIKKAKEEGTRRRIVRPGISFAKATGSIAAGDDLEAKMEAVIAPTVITTLTV